MRFNQASLSRKRVHKLYLPSPQTLNSPDALAIEVKQVAYRFGPEIVSILESHGTADAKRLAWAVDLYFRWRRARTRPKRSKRWRGKFQIVLHNEMPKLKQQ